MSEDVSDRGPGRSREPVGVLLMAYGAPEHLDEVESFLLDVRGGRETARALVEEVKDRYRAIGGGSPLLGVTTSQASALQALLTRRDGRSGSGGRRFRVAVGMRHWHPTIGEAVARLAGEGCRSLVAIPLAPHCSDLSVGAYFQALEPVLAEPGAKPIGAVRRVRGFHDHPLFLDAWADRVRSAFARVRERGGDPAEAELLFTAHSLPESILEEGDPYPDQLLATARGVMDRLAEADSPLPAGWRLCYQSAGARAVPWLGPSIGEVLEELAAAGRRRVLAAPIGFVSDHVEVLYDLDLEAAAHAGRLGIHFDRTESLNTSPRFIEALADLVLARRIPNS